MYLYLIYWMLCCTVCCKTAKGKSFQIHEANLHSLEKLYGWPGHVSRKEKRLLRGKLSQMAKNCESFLLKCFVLFGNW